ncbi:hypothetical protein PS645_02234 [Pseudomonas fluorescens]|uniref:Uncharacterized protein n=1 Tax=Pseudomonas fluorescens TaxID=294 RepID=A0A5E6SIZ5_PSEFL|nr:hypothetical protein PS645_02234 [Pseudomonas fluorescens]
MRRGAAASCENAGDTCRIKPRDVGRTDFIHHQNVRLLRLTRRFNTAQSRQHPATNVTQVGSAFSQQCVLQRFLLFCCSFDHRHPRRFRAFALLEAGIDFIGQFRVVEHLLMRDENLANRFGGAAFDQPFDVASYVRQRLPQTLALNGRRFTAQRIFDHLLHLNMRRADGDAGGRGDRLNQAAGGRCEQYFSDIREHFRLLTDSGQWLDFFAKAFFDGSQQGRQRIGGNVRFGNELQHLTATGAKAEQFAQTLHRHRAVLTVDNPHADFAIKTFRQLREDLRRPRVQTMGIGQGDSRTRPIDGQFAAEHFKDFSAAGRSTQFVAATFDQQRAQTFEQ